VRARTWQVGALLFGSGCCALVYQIGWLREFRLIFGASTAASAAVLAIFIGGLGLGGLLLGGLADRHPRPILFYAQLETVVALFAAASPLLLALVRVAYVGVGGTSRLGLIVGTVVRLILSALVLAIPTVAMGGTLPAAARGATRDTDARRQDTAALYALNTLGAVFGAALATFALLELFGTRATLWLAAAVNLLIAMTARQLDRQSAPAPDRSADRAPRLDDAVADVASAAPVPFVLLASGIVGFAFFVMELVWYRMLGPLLGGSVFTFGLILAVALAGIGIGGLVYAVLGRDRPATLEGFAVSCLLEAAAMAATFAFGDRLALVAVVLFPLARAGFAARIVGWAVTAGIVVLPPAIVAGYQFPLLIGLFGRGRERLGRQVGLAYATNTVGAIAGSLAGGFGLLPWLSATGVWRFASGCLLILGLGAVTLAVHSGVRRRLAPALALTAATLALLASVGPTALWRHSGVGAGRSGIDTIVSRNQLRSWRNGAQRSIVWAGDGIESSVALAIQPSGYAFLVNGKSDGSTRGDTSTMVWTGMIGGLLAPNPQRALVIGLGTGASAGWLGAVPSIQQVDVVELEPLIVDVARACRAVNLDVMSNPKVRITIGDARERLLTSKRTYDLIVSQPSNPFRAGIASLFTKEYYEAARNRLTPDGAFVQWIQAYEIDARTLRTVFATFASAFPHVETWQVGPDDLALIGATHPLGYTADGLAARIAAEPFRSALAVGWHATDLNGVVSHYLAGDRTARAIATARGVEVNTDDRNVVEYGFARTLGASGVLTNELRELARAIGDGRPALDEQAVDWPLVETARVSFLAAENYGLNAGPSQDGSPEEVARRSALISYYARNDYAAARSAWSRAGDRRPRDPAEAAMAADIEADAGGADALNAIGRLRAFDRGEADTVLASLRLRSSDIDGATGALEAAFHDFRVSPWSAFRFKLKALVLANVVAKVSPTAARRMLAALDAEFSVRAMEMDRITTAATISRLVDFKGLCAPLVGLAEPHVPWDLKFLALRRDCYQLVGDGRARRAELDLNEFLQAEPLALASGLGPQQDGGASSSVSLMRRDDQ
jgi:predicted membrane-bound spermidine synthase